MFNFRSKSDKIKDLEDKIILLNKKVSFYEKKLKSLEGFEFILNTLEGNILDIDHASIEKLINTGYTIKINWKKEIIISYHLGTYIDDKYIPTELLIYFKSNNFSEKFNQDINIAIEYTIKWHQTYHEILLNFLRNPSKENYNGIKSNIEFYSNKSYPRILPFT